MAKASTKSATAPKKATAAKKTSSAPDIEKVSEDVLAKLRSLNLDPQLQSDIEWCLGSFRSDGNPVGLYDMARRALNVLKTELEKKTKGVTAKLVADIQKVLESK